jgi:hypothetical protein
MGVEGFNRQASADISMTAGGSQEASVATGVDDTGKEGDGGSDGYNDTAGMGSLGLGDEGGNGSGIEGEDTDGDTSDDNGNTNSDSTEGNTGPEGEGSDVDGKGDDSDGNGPTEGGKQGGERPDVGGDYTKLTDWRGSNWEDGPKQGDEDPSKRASQRLDEYQKNDESGTDDSAREQGASKERQEPSAGGDTNPTGNRGISSGKVTGDIPIQRGGESGREEVTSSTYSVGEAQEELPGGAVQGKKKGRFLGQGWEDMVKRKGGSAVSGAHFLPKGGGHQLSDGKRPLGAWDKSGVEMKRLKAHAEAISGWNSEAVRKYKERLLKDPGVASELAKKYHRLENPGAVG